ncbi:hypothetical protein ACIBM4_12420 [Streptomyces sp. NPDC050256]|uniref:hypothetical protein n=1 Tax=unclassified Streptomyces TaxID=2593676 RepID=UPI0037B7B3D0
MTPDGSSPVYEARYGWDRKTISVVAMAAVLTVLLIVTDVSTALRVTGLALFGGGALFMAFVALSRRPAFRVDASGVLLGGSPGRYRATTAHVPWQDITAIVLWRQKTPGSAMPWVGVVLRPGAVIPPGPGQGEVARATLRALVPHVPADVVLTSRAVNGWRLDRTALTTAVGTFATGIPVVDAG